MKFIFKLILALFFPAVALAQFVTAGLTYPDGLEPGNPSTCEAPAGKTCYWVDCDAVADGTGTYASPFWGFETVFGYYNSGASYVQGSAVGGDVVYVKGTCLPSASSDDATGPYKLVRIGRAAQLGTSAEPTIIKSWRGEAQAILDGEYRTTLGTQVRAENSPNTGLIRVEQSATGSSYLKIQNIKIKRYHTDGIRVEYNTEGVHIESVTCEDGRVDQTGAQGCIVRHYNTAIVYSDTIARNYFINNNHTCDTYVGDPDSSCTATTNDGTVTLLSSSAASNGSTVNIYENLDVNSTKFVHQKHNGNITANIYRNKIVSPYTVLHLRAKQTNFYENVVVTPTAYWFEMDPENETLNVGLYAYNNSGYMTAGRLMYSLDQWNDDGAIKIYNNAITSTSTDTPFITLAPYAGQYFARANLEVDHNYFNVPAGVQSTFSCLGPTSAGSACTNRNLTDTKTELSDTTTVTTDPGFVNVAGQNLTLSATSTARTAGRSSAVIGAITHSLPEFCGDTVRGKASTACTGTGDLDNDGYLDGDDCDDTNMWVYPGKWTGDGCSGGQIRKCNSGGSYGACQAFACADHSTSGTCKFIDCDLGSNSNAGTSAAPWQSLQMIGEDSGTKISGWHDLAPGDTVLVSGYCDDYYDTTSSSARNAIVLLGSAQSGSAGNPVTIMQWPGRPRARFTAPFTYGGTQGSGFFFDNADYVTIRGLEVSNMRLRKLGATSSGSDGSGEGTGDAFFLDNGSDNVTIEDNYIHDISCHKSDNCSAIENTAGSDAITVKRNVIWDIADELASDTALCNAISGNKAVGFYRSADLVFTHNVVGYSNLRDDQVSKKRGIPFNIKHGLPTSLAGTQQVHYNTFVNGCEGTVEAGGANLSLKYNRLIQNQYAHIHLKDLGGATFLQNIEVSYNTVRAGKFLFLNLVDGYNTDQSIASDSCSGNEEVGPISVHHNVVDDWSTSYSQDYAFLYTYPYNADNLYTQFITGGKISIDNNCYNTDAANLRFGLNEANNGCATACCQYGSLGAGYTTFTLWKGTGFDANSVQSDPLLNSSDVNTTADPVCLAAGWRGVSSSSVGHRPAPAILSIGGLE